MPRTSEDRHNRNEVSVTQAFEKDEDDKKKYIEAVGSFMEVEIEHSEFINKIAKLQ